MSHHRWVRRRLAIAVLLVLFVLGVVVPLVAEGESESTDGVTPVQPQESGEPVSPMPPPPEDAPLEMFLNVDTSKAARVPRAVAPGGIRPGGRWRPQGPGPIVNGQLENVVPDNQAIGAIHTVIAHPTDPDVLWIGAVNGGVWTTSDATSVRPSWTPLTDDHPSLSIGALALDRNDPSNDTLVAGIGLFSSFGSAGGDLTGLLRTVDGGDNWTLIDGDGVLQNKSFSGVAARGDTIVASVSYALPFTFDNIGIFRSTDAGATFTHVSRGDGSETGLAAALCTDLVGDPASADTLYTAALFADWVGGENGIFKSNDAGATWSKVSDAAIDSLIISGTTSNIEMSVGDAGQIYAGVINLGQLVALFRSGDGGATWTQLDTPVTNENGLLIGIHPRLKGPGPDAPPEEIGGSQGRIHFSILADEIDPFIVYVGGDRQPNVSGFPNSIGARNYSGRLFRVDASLPAGEQAIALTHNPTTFRNSSPHADSREMVFDARGEIVEVDDGGIYRRTNPRDRGDWYSVIGNLQVTEFHDIAYDNLSDVILGGTQDNGTPLQGVPEGLTWSLISGGDGGDVAVDDVSLAHLNQSIRYSSFQYLGAFRKQIYRNNILLTSTRLAVRVVGTGRNLFEVDPFIRFVQPIELNVIDPTRGLIATASLYESLNQFGQLTDLTGFTGFHITATAYGGRSEGLDYPGLIYYAAGPNLYLRTISGGPFAQLTAYSGETPRDMVLDPDEWRSAFVIDSDQAFMTSDGGTSWTEITGNLSELSSSLRVIEFAASEGESAIFVGGRSGVFRMFIDQPGVWEEFGTGLPNAPVRDMDYDATDDVLVVATLGRGAWTMPLITCAAGDADDDVVCDDADNCLGVGNPGQADVDGDGVGDACDNCVFRSLPGFDFDFETGAEGWTSASRGAANTWHLDTLSCRGDDLGSTMFVSNGNDGPDCVEDSSYEYSQLLSPPVQLPAGGPLRLSFDALSFDEGGGCRQSSSFDLKDAGISLDGGAFYNLLNQCEPLADGAGSLIHHDYDISSFAGQQVQVVIVYDTLENHFGHTFAVDNVRITAMTPPNPGQEDADGDGKGDVCDDCTDWDADGFGDPGFALNICALDTCPALYNPDQLPDETPPEVMASVDVDLLWPPNHTMKTVRLAVSATDECSLEPALDVLLESVMPSEPDDAAGVGDGHTTGDIQDVETETPDFEMRLRAERDGDGPGRLYTVTYRSTDLAGNSGYGFVDIFVPHDLGGVVEPLQLSVADRAATVVSWNPVAGAEHYDVIRGDLSQIGVRGSSIELGPTTCVENRSTDTTTAGFEDTEMPAPGEGFFYLVQFHDGLNHNSYGTESASRPRVVGLEDCPD